MVVSLPVPKLGPLPARRYLRPPAPLHFPEEEPVPESREHRMTILVLFSIVLRELGDRAIVASDQFLYFDPTDPKRRLAPDLAVRRGPPVQRLPSWKTWQHGAPEVGVEIVSDYDRSEGPFERKLERYRQAGVGEVVRYDAEDRERPVRLWDLFDGDLVERDLGDPEAFRCDALGLYWCVWDGPWGRMLRLAYDAAGERLVLSPEEAERVKTRAEHERAEAAHERAEAEHERAEAERAAKESAFRRIAELEAERTKG
jgi:Uma2 family endonuclease